MKKRFILFTILIILISSSVYAFSITDVFDYFNDIFNRDVVGKKISSQDRDGKLEVCKAAYLEDYKCSNNYLQKLYQNKDCSKDYKNYEYCSYECGEGKCLEEPIKEVIKSDEDKKETIVKDLTKDEEIIDKTEPVIKDEIEPVKLECEGNKDCFSKSKCKFATCLPCEDCSEPTYVNVCSCEKGLCEQTKSPAQPKNYCEKELNECEKAGGNCRNICLRGEVENPKLSESCDETTPVPIIANIIGRNKCCIPIEVEETEVSCPLMGDLNSNAQLDCNDINLLSDYILNDQYDVCGDLNNDTLLDIFDITLLINELSNNNVQCCNLVGDVNSDGNVDCDDIANMQTLILNDEFHICGDINQDNALDIFDVIKLVNQLSSEGISCENKKDLEMYEEKQVFLISDKNWKDVLSLVPIGVWTDNQNNIHKYPILIYHDEGPTSIFPNLALGASVTASSNYPSSPPENAVDGLKSTNWNNGNTNPGVLTIDLNQIVSINKIELYNLGDRYYATIEVGEDGEDYDLIESNRILEQGNNIFDFSNKNAIYVKITLTDSPEQGTYPNWKMINEVRVFNTNQEQVIVNPIDLDSTIHFLQLYEPDKVIIVGDTLQELDNLLIAPQELGAGLNEEQIERIYPENYLDYWENYNEVVYVEDDYEKALLASTYASLINAPLIIEDTSIIIDPPDIQTDAILDPFFSNKLVTLVGNLDCPVGVVSCTSFETIDELQQKYVELTDTDKIILVNPNDLNIFLEDEFMPERTLIPIFKPFSKHSLAAPILASAKHELIITAPHGGVPPSSGCEGNEELLNNFFETEEMLNNKIDELVSINPEYLTIIASPLAITESSCQGDYINDDYRSNLDYFYSIEPNTITKSNYKFLVDHEGNINIFYFKRLKRFLGSFYPFSINYVKVDNSHNVITSEKEIIRGYGNSLVSIIDAAIDNENNINIVYSGRANLNYIKLDNNGNLIINRENIVSLNQNPTFNELKMEIDSLNNIHLIWRYSELVESVGEGGIAEINSEKRIEYQKFNNIGVPLTSIINLAGSTDSFLGDPDLSLDYEDNVYLIWPEFGSFHYKKLDSNGEEIIDEEIILDNIGKDLIIETDENSNLHVFWTKRTAVEFEITNETETNETITEDNETISSWRSYSEIYYVKLNNQGEIIVDVKEVTSDQTDGILNKVRDVLIDSNGHLKLLYIIENRAYLPYEDTLSSLRLNNEGTIMDEMILDTAQQRLEYSSFSLGNQNNVNYFWRTDEIYHQIEDNEKGIILIEEDFLDMKTGRIYSLTTSDVSSYIARSIFYDELINDIYEDDEFTGTSIAREVIDDEPFAYKAKDIKDKVNLFDYNSVCSTHMAELECEDTSGNPLDESFFKEKQFIGFMDHGFVLGWGSTIATHQLPWMDLPYVFGGDACSTNHFWHVMGGAATFGPNMIRKGAIAYTGNLGVVGYKLPTDFSMAIKFLTQEDRKSIGETNSYLYEVSNRHKRYAILLGDPTLIPRFKEVNWGNECNDSLDNDNDGLIDYPNDPGCSSLEDNNEFNKITEPVLEEQ